MRNGPATGPGVPATSGAPYGFKLYGKLMSTNWTPGAETRLDNAGAVTVGINTGSLPRYTHTVTPGQIWVYRVVPNDAATPTPNTAVALSDPANSPAVSDYLIIQGARSAAGALPTLASKYANGVCVMVAGNSFIGQMQDSDPYSVGIKNYLEANGVPSGGVKTAVLGFPGSTLGVDWGATRAIFNPGGNGPTGTPFGAYGIEGNRTNKNLLANLIDRTAALSAANPGLPVVIVFYELTNAAQHVVAQSEITADWNDIVAACASRNWQVVLEQPAWLVQTGFNPDSHADVLLSGFATLSGLMNNTDSFAGDDTFFYRSFVNAADWYYGTGTDNSGVHVIPAVAALMGPVWGENLRRNLMAGESPSESEITGVTVTPATKTVYPGGYAVLTATVAGTDSFDDSVDWSKVVSGSALVLEVKPDGSVTVLVPTNTPVGTYQVLATSVQDGSHSALATITVQALPSSGGGGSRPTWQPGDVEFGFTIVDSCTRMDIDGDQPLLIMVKPTLLSGQYLPVTDFDPEISVTSDGTSVWQTATWAPGARAALQVTGSEADTPLALGSYVVRIRLKNAVGTVLRSDRIGIIDVS